MNTTTDQELLQRYKRDKDPAAIRELISRHASMVYATARRVAPADAEDVVQVVFLLLWQKTTTLKQATSLAGWLYQATTYACRNANKVRSRREHYEREAAMLRRERVQTGNTEIEATRALLDDALSQLAEGYRQAVLLRYLEGLSAEETGGRLGTTARAAAKRAERGLQKLRTVLASKGHGEAACHLEAVLAAEATARLPEAISTGLGKLLAGGAASGKISTLASTTARALATATTKAIAAWTGIAALLAIAVTGGATWLTASGPAKALQRPLPQPARMQILAEDESKIPGTPRVYRHEMLVEQGLCDAILKDATRVPSQGEWELYRMPVTALREWMIGAPKERVYHSHEHGPSVATPEPAASDQRGVFFNFYSLGSTIMVQTPEHPAVTVVPRGGVQGQVWADRAGVHFPLKENNWSIEVLGLPGGTVTKSGTLSADATLRPGETLLAVLKLGELHDGDYSLMIAMDVFNASDVQTERITDLRETELWMRFGPGLCRQIADRAGQWQKTGHPSEQPPERWRKRLSDGSVVQLESVAAPSRWPGIAWDGDGNALNGGQMTDWGESEGKLTIRGRVIWMTAPTALFLRGQWNWNDKDKPSQWTDFISSDASASRIRVPAGPFANAGCLERGRPLTVGPLTVTLRTLEKEAGVWSLVVDISGNGRDRQAYAIAPVVVTKGGSQVGPEENLSEDHYYRDQAREPARKEPLSLRFLRRDTTPDKQDEFDHVELLWRKAEVVTFEGFATAPLGSDMADLKRAVTAALRPAVGKAAGIAKAEAARTQLPEGERPEDSIQELVSAVAAGNRDEIRKRITGKDEVCDSFVEVMLARQQLRDALEKRLGVVPDIPGLQGWMSMDRTLESTQYRIREDGVAVGEQVVCRRGAEGVWRLDLDRSFGGEFSSDRMKEMTRVAMPLIRRLTEDLGTGRISSAGQVRNAWDEIGRQVQKHEDQR